MRALRSLPLPAFRCRFWDSVSVIVQRRQLYLLAVITDLLNTLGSTLSAYRLSYFPRDLECSVFIPRTGAIAFCHGTNLAKQNRERRRDLSKSEIICEEYRDSDILCGNKYTPVITVAMNIYRVRHFNWDASIFQTKIVGFPSGHALVCYWFDLRVEKWQNQINVKNIIFNGTWRFFIAHSAYTDKKLSNILSEDTFIQSKMYIKMWWMDFNCSWPWFFFKS